MNEHFCACGAIAAWRMAKAFLRPAGQVRAFVSLSLIPAGWAIAQHGTGDLTNKSLEDLMNIQVVSVSSAAPP